MRLLYLLFPSIQVVKFLVKKNSNNALNGQVTIGTLIFQVIILHIQKQRNAYDLFYNFFNLVLVFDKIMLLAYCLPYCQFWVANCQ